MKVKRFIFLVILCLGMIISRSNCYAQVPTSLDLINNAKQYDGKTISYKGEVIGEVMIRGDHAWLHVNDGYVAIGVWVRKADLKDIIYLGCYRTKGDIIEVSGIFNRSCLEHGGDLDIHVQEVKKILSGEPSFKQLSMKKFYIGLFLTFVLLFLYSINKFFWNKRK